MQHYNLGEYAEALDSFKAAYREFEEPSFLYNIAQCQRALDRKKEAVRSYRAFLRESKELDPAVRAKVDETIANLEAALRDEQAKAARRDEQAQAASEAKTNPPAELKPTTPPASAASVPASAASEPTLVAAAPAPAAKKPVYKKWWLWTAVGGVVVAGVGVGLGLWLAPHNTTYPSAQTTGGTDRF